MKSKQPTVIILYGPIAVGKLTVANILAKKLGYVVAHNHALNDAVTDIFPRESKEYGKVIQKMRTTFFREIMQTGTDFIVTHCYAHDYVSPATGLLDPVYVQKQKQRLTRYGARVCVVHLRADPDILIQRVQGESRKQWKKLTDIKKMKQAMREKDWQTSAPVQGQLIIDTTDLKPEKTAEMIIKHFSLKT